MRKPDPELFEAMLKLLALSADQCVFVADTEEYVQAAEKLGFAGVHAQQPEQTVSRLEALLRVPLTDAH